MAISIHALREEGDREQHCRAFGRDISIHALREEGDRQHDFHVWRIHDISIHALREEGDANGLDWVSCWQISIHALREEGDIIGNGQDGTLEVFLSTPSARRATLSGQGGDLILRISIHALREEGDLEYQDRL